MVRTVDPSPGPVHPWARHGNRRDLHGWIYDEIGRCVGLPAVLGDIPLDQLGATGFGLAIAAEAVAATGLVELRGARVATPGPPDACTQPGESPEMVGHPVCQAPTVASTMTVVPGGATGTTVPAIGRPSTTSDVPRVPDVVRTLTR